MIEPTKEAGDLMVDAIRHALAVVGAVHGITGDAGTVHSLLAHCPQGRWDAVIVALAAMVDPDARPVDLLAWTRPTPPGMAPVIESTPAEPGTLRRAALPREHGTPRGYWQHRDAKETTCTECRAAYTVSRRPQVCRDEYARLRAAGVPILEAVDRSALRVLLARQSRADLRSVPA